MTDCKIEPRSARSCERGTGGCVIHHTGEGKAVTAPVWRYMKTGGLYRIVGSARMATPDGTVLVIYENTLYPGSSLALPADEFHDGRFQPVWSLLEDQHERA